MFSLGHSACVWLGKVTELKLRACCGLSPGRESQQWEKMGTEPRLESESGIRVVEEIENTDKSGGQGEKHHSAMSWDPEANYFTGYSHWLKVPDQFFPRLGFLPLGMPAAEPGIGHAVIVWRVLRIRQLICLICRRDMAQRRRMLCSSSLSCSVLRSSLELKSHYFQ